MTDRLIFFELNNHLKEIQKIYPTERIFGIYAETASENILISRAVIIPAFEEICTSTKLINNKITIGKGECEIIDIRAVLEATKNGIKNLISALDSNYIIINPMFHHLFVKLYKEKREDIANGIKSNVPSAYLKQAITKVCRLAWNESSNAVRFIKQLTDIEKLALDEIIKSIGDEGTISQAKIASAAKVSRLTMSNLIMKMKDYGVAEITYFGTAGTYIKIIDDTLLNIHGIVMPRKEFK